MFFRIVFSRQPSQEGNDRQAKAAAWQRHGHIAWATPTRDPRMKLEANPAVAIVHRAQGNRI